MPPEIHTLLAFIWALLNKGLALLTGGLIALVIIAVEKWRGRAISWHAFLSIVVIALLPAAYFCWRDEYIKNTGHAYFRFSFPEIETIDNAKINFVVNAQNDTSRPITIENIELARIWIADTPPFLKLIQNTLQCKEFVNVNPDVAKSMAEAGPPNNPPQRWHVNGRVDVWFEFLHVDSVKTDDIPKSSSETIIGPGSGHIFSIEASGQTVDRTQFADVVLCPIMVFSTETVKQSIICPGAGQGKSVSNGQILRQKEVNDKIFPLRLPNSDEECKAI